MNSDPVEQACQCLNAGHVVAIPTETVYGLAADATNDMGVAEIYAIKQRPSFNPLIAHVANLGQALQLGQFSIEALKLARAFWRPGTLQHRPLTLVVPLKSEAKISKLATAGLDTLGIRVPCAPLTQSLLQRYPHPLVAPSANLSQSISATCADVVRLTLGDKVSCILDGGCCPVGLESTILDASKSPMTILRFGGTSIEEISEILGYTPKTASTSEAIKAPGMMKRHYAPSLPLKMNQTRPVKETAYLGFGPYDFGEYNLSPAGDLKVAASHLFHYLFLLDNPKKYTSILVAPIPMKGLGIAINDRLTRASCVNEQ